MSSITIRRGTEGPRHDPYSFEEITVRRADGRSVTIHTGLAFWVKASDGRIEQRETGPAIALFVEVASITPHQAEKAVRELRDRQYRYHPCGMKYLKDAAGYPGELFVFCAMCGDVIDAEFNIRAVE